MIHGARCNRSGVEERRGAIGLARTHFPNFQDALIGVSLGEGMVSRIG